MKKRILAVILSVCVAASMTGCSTELSNEYITIKQYKGLEVAQVEKTEVTDEMVESEISSRLEQASVTEDITDRAVENGDTVNIDFSGSVDGVAFDGGTAQGSSLEIGSGTFIGAEGNYKGFEEQLIGHKIGEEFTIQVQFPAEYKMNTALSGKVADFAIKINSIQKITTPELTDKWVKKNSESSKTVDEYKKEVRGELEKNYEDDQMSSLKSEALQALYDQTDVKKYPEDQLEETKTKIAAYYKNAASSYNMEFADFLSSYMGMTEDEFNEQVDTAAKNSVKQKLAVELLAKKKNLEPTDEEYQKKYKEYAKQYNFDSVDAMIEQAGEDVLKEMVLQEVVSEYLAKNCVQVEQTTDDTTTESGNKKTDGSFSRNESR